MALFQVHPHFGYLNSDVLLINSSDAPLLVKDSNDGKDYTIPASSNYPTRLNAGEHKFIVVGDESISETVVVEDAIKLGGSKDKKVYIFEGTPWVLWIMLDRTYFFNRDTNEQYIEHGLTPEDIRFLTSNYLLFVSGKDNSLFSLDNLAIEKTIGDSSFLFSNEHYAVFSSSDGLLLYSLERAEEKLLALKCDDHTIDKANQILYYHKPYEKQILIKQLSAPTSTDSSYNPRESFRCFIGDQSVIYGNNPQTLYIVNLQSQKDVKLYEDIIPVTKISGKKIWTNTAADLIEENETHNSYTSYAELEVYERGDRWFYIKNVTHIIKNRGVKSEKDTHSLRLTNEDVTIIDLAQKPTVIRGKSFDCVQTTCDKKGVLIFDDSISEFEGKPIISPAGFILIAKKNTESSMILEDPLNASQKYLDADQEIIDIYKEWGLIKINGSSINGDQKNNVLFRNPEDMKAFEMPCNKDRLVAVSEHCNYVIVRDEDGIKLFRYHLDKNEWNGSPLCCMNIDQSSYCKAVFCSDGEHIIYQKEGKSFFFRRIGSDDESEFEFQGSVIKRDINGYIPYLDFDTHKKPVYVDPVSLTRIEDAAAWQFTFQSVDGSITHVDHNIVKYYNKETNQEVSKKEYDEYRQRYDYSDDLNYHMQKTKEHNRTVYYEKNKAWLNKVLGRVLNPLKLFIAVPNVCDAYIFTKKYYVREEMNGHFIDIPIPEELRFLNYVSYSIDNKYIIVSGRFPEDSYNKGLALVYDIEGQSIPYKRTNTLAVWLGVISKNGMVAYYDSTPNTYISDSPMKSFQTIEGRSFLTFSPTGKYIALSCQGYIPYSPNTPHWGHQPSCDVYIALSDSPNKELAHYCDHGDSIEGLSELHANRDNHFVASATFSKDEKKLMTVSDDGVIVVRNLHFEDMKESSEEKYPF